MKKRFQKKMSGYLAMALSASMALGSTAAPLNVLADDFYFEDLEDFNEDSNNTNKLSRKNKLNIASSSNASYKNDLPDEFGSDAFWRWYASASETDLEEWYESIKEEDIATDSDADYNYPECDLEDEDKLMAFEEWFIEHCYSEDGDGFIIDYDALLEYISHSSFESAKSALNWLDGYLNLTTFGPLGSMIPETYGTGADFNDGRHGTGDIDNPYVLDSVEDLRGLAIYVLQENGASGEYFKIEAGTYDLNGTWIPIGFTGNPGGTYIPFQGHIAAEDGVVIDNFGFGYNAGGLTSAQSAAIREQKHLGFFGMLRDATVEGLEIQTDNNTIEGTGDVGILAGYAVNSTIKDCSVKGHVKGHDNSNVGGIVGKIESSSGNQNDRNSVIEDVFAQDVSVYISEDKTPNSHGAVGGVAGYAQGTIIADATVKTNTTAGRHIYGDAAYTGGIVGIQEDTDLYNVYVRDGEIGEGSDFAVGGIVGGYNGGQLKVARFGGDIIRPTNTNSYQAAFIGTRVNNAGFTYGDNGNIAYLFTDSVEKANTGICGSKIQDDNNYGKDAHIGYWNKDNTRYTLVTGNNQDPQTDYFFEELERGIIAIKKYGNFTQEGNKKVIINHYTADETGQPIRGYMLTVIDPLVDGLTAAKVTAQIRESYKPTVTSENLGAYAPGDKIYITFANQSDGNVQFRLDPNEETNPYYAYHEYDLFEDYEDDGNDAGNVEKHALYKDGGYWLTMPEADTIVSAEYKKVAQVINLNPNRIVFDITHTRTGNRANPEVKWEVTAKDEHGQVITDGTGRRWENVVLSEDLDRSPNFFIQSMLNNVVNDKFPLNWSTGNTNNHGIISNMQINSDLALDKNASFDFQIKGSAMEEYVNEEVEKQHANGDKDSISTVKPLYWHTQITASAQKDDSFNPDEVPTGYCDIDINFSIKDTTKTSIEGVNLSKNTITYDVVRTLSGDRKNPKEVYTINGQTAESGDSSKLEAVFTPDYFSNESVEWYLSTPKDGDVFDDIRDDAVEADEGNKDDQTIRINQTNGENAYRNANIDLIGVTSNSCGDNDFISRIVNEQNKETEQLRQVANNTHTYTKYVKVTAHDANNGNKTDTCKVVVNFKTDDKTEIKPESIEIQNKSNISGYKVYYTFEGNSKSDITDRTITALKNPTQPLQNGVGQKLEAVMTPEVEGDNYVPYNKEIIWELGNPKAAEGSKLDVNDVLRIDSKTGQITVRGYGDSTDVNSDAYSPWIQSLITSGQLDGVSVPVRIIAKSAESNDVLDYVDINVEFVAQTMESEVQDGIEFNPVLFKETATSLAGTDITAKQTWFGINGQPIDATVTGTEGTPVFTIYDETGTTVVKDIITIDDMQKLRSITSNKYVNINENADWIKDIIDARVDGNKGTKKLIVKAKSSGSAEIEIPVTINFEYHGTDLYVNTLTELPEEYKGNEKETYDINKAKVNDRTITLDVVATQGNYTEDNPGTRKWTYGIAKLDNNTYTPNGVGHDATYTLSGDVAKYAKIENGYLVPTKGLWENVISNNETTGSVSGVVTASKEVDGRIATDSYKVTINFKYNKAVLDVHEKTLDLVYTDNSRTNSEKSSWSGEDNFQLTANVETENGIDINVDWKTSDEGIVKLEPRGKYCTVTVDKDTWIKEIIANADKYGTSKDAHKGTKTVLITATDSKTGEVADTCKITVNFRYDQVVLDSNEEVYDIVLTQTSRTNNPSVKWQGNDIRKLNAEVFVEPGLNDNAFWTSEDAGIVKVDDAGNIEPIIDADWMKQLVKEGKFAGQKKVAVNVTNKDGSIKDSCNVVINFKYENVVMNENAKTMDVTLTASGVDTNPTYKISGNSAAIKAVLNSINPEEKNVLYASSNSGLVNVDKDGKLTFTLPAGLKINADGTLAIADTVNNKNSVKTELLNNSSAFVKEAMKHEWTEKNPYVSTTTAVITASSEDKRMADQCNVTIKLKYIDDTYHRSSGGGGGGGSSSGGGGGSSSSGVTPGGTKTGSSNSLPKYVVTGTWVKDNTGKWLFTAGRTYTNEWAAVHNPYADVTKGQPQFDWFRFDEKGYMVTGWFNDPVDGNTYFLHNISDNTLGHMYTGWHWITGDDGLQRCYFFQTESNGTKGKLFRNTTTPDGYTVDATGAWTVNGQVVTRQPQ